MGFYSNFREKNRSRRKETQKKIREILDSNEREYLQLIYKKGQQNLPKYIQLKDFLIQIFGNQGLTSKVCIPCEFYYTAKDLLKSRSSSKEVYSIKKKATSFYANQMN